MKRYIVTVTSRVAIELEDNDPRTPFDVACAATDASNDTNTSVIDQMLEHEEERAYDATASFDDFASSFI